MKNVLYLLIVRQSLKLTKLKEMEIYNTLSSHQCKGI